MVRARARPRGVLRRVLAGSGPAVLVTHDVLDAVTLADHVVVLEDGRPLGPAHAVHATIREQGRGAFSHWLDQVYFSSSDGSDPRSNGREYVIEIPDAPGDDRQSPAGGAAPAGASTTE